MNSTKITSLANGTASSDAAAFGQIGGSVTDDGTRISLASPRISLANPLTLSGSGGTFTVAEDLHVTGDLVVTGKLTVDGKIKSDCKR
jgi:hypothetical protein